MRKSVIVVPVVLTAALLSGACAKGSGSPVAPTALERAGASSVPAPTPTPVALGSAQISGVVVNGTPAAAPAGATFAGLGQITVAVLGTPLTAVSDGNGAFTIQNVPSGTVTLALSGSGVNAQVAVSGVAPQEQIRVTVRVAGGAASLDDSHRVGNDNTIEVVGTLTAIGANTVTVGSLATPIGLLPTTLVTRSGKTVSASLLAVGQRVEVHAVRAGGTVTAERINIESSTDDAPGSDGRSSDDLEVHLSGSLPASPSGVCPVISFAVGSTKVITKATTRFDDMVCASLKAGDAVSIEGIRQSDGAVLASEIKRAGSSSSGSGRSGQNENDDKGGSSGSGSNSGSGGNSGSGSGGSTNRGSGSGSGSSGNGRGSDDAKGGK